jgi:hypothetical protein
MPRSVKRHRKKLRSLSFQKYYHPAQRVLPFAPELRSKGYRPLNMEFEDQLKALIYYHLEEHTSGRHLVQVLKEDDFARKNIAPKTGINKSSFFEAINHRGLEQMQSVYNNLCIEASSVLPKKHRHLGELVAIDGSLINGVLSMAWADYRKNSKKAKIHLGFNVNKAIPSKIFFTNGNGAERPFVSQILSPGQTGICDRGYQDHAEFDSLQEQGKRFVIRIKANTTRTIVRRYDIRPDSIVFFDSEVLLGTVQNNNQTQKSVRLVGYRIHHVEYWIATDRRDITAEQVAEIYKLRWEIESFFAWWKRHLKMYHLIARSPYGLMVQIYAGLITYLLLAIYCHQNHGEAVSIKRARALRIQIQNELRDSGGSPNEYFFKEHDQLHAKT